MTDDSRNQWNEDSLREGLYRHDETALEAVSRQYGRILKGLARQITGSEPDAEECVNDALLDLWNAVPPDRPHRILAYVSTLVRRRAVDRVRYRTASCRGGEEYEDSMEELAECLADPDGESHLETVAIRDCLQRFLQGLPNVKMILSGMSNMDHMTDNVATFAERKPLSQEETDLLLQIAEEMKNVIPCTGCRYCCDGCPVGLDIPAMMSICSDLRFSPSINSVLMLQPLPEEKKPSACISCGKCTKVCPQNIDIPAVMKELATRMEAMPSWVEICRQREADQKNSKDI